MAEMPPRQAEPVGMTESQASALAEIIKLAGFTARALRNPIRGNAPANSMVWVVEAEVNTGWETFFSTEQWVTDPNNPDRRMARNW